MSWESVNQCRSRTDHNRALTRAIKTNLAEIQTQATKTQDGILQIQAGVAGLRNAQEGMIILRKSQAWEAYSSSDRSGLTEGPPVAHHNRLVNEPQCSSHQASTYNWRMVRLFRELYHLDGSLKPDYVASWYPWMWEDSPMLYHY